MYVLVSFQQTVVEGIGSEGINRAGVGNQRAIPFAAERKRDAGFFVVGG